MSWYSTNHIGSVRYWLDVYWINLISIDHVQLNVAFLANLRWREHDRAAGCDVVKAIFGCLNSTNSATNIAIYLSAHGTAVTLHKFITHWHQNPPFSSAFQKEQREASDKREKRLHALIDWITTYYHLSSIIQQRGALLVRKIFHSTWISVTWSHANILAIFHAVYASYVASIFIFARLFVYVNRIRPLCICC